MGNYILCRHPLSESPFHIESIHLNLYSLEELCFFLSNNLVLSDEVIRNPELKEWLADECGMKGLIKEYEAIADKEGRISNRLVWILGKSHYFSEMQLRKLKMKIDSIDGMSLISKQKLKADSLLKYGKYKRSIDCYERIFKMDGIYDESAGFRADVYYNMGVAYEKMFQSGKALECFLKSYACEEKAEFLEACLKAAYFDGGKDTFLNEAKELGADEETVSKVLAEIDSIKPYDMPEDIDETINKWIHDYHMSVDQ